MASARRGRSLQRRVGIVGEKVPPGLDRLANCELLEAIAAEQTVFIVEGEPKVDLLRRWKVPATCNAGGAGNSQRFSLRAA